MVVEIGTAKPKMGFIKIRWSPYDRSQCVSQNVNVRSIGASQREIARELHISKTTVNKYLSQPEAAGKIEEADFACLYCNDNGRPNSPVNCMISALILKERHNWSYSELFKQLHFHLDAEDVVTLIPAEELGSGCLQSPDDEDAIYRRNRGESCGVETAMYEFVCGKPDHKLTVR